MKLLAERLEERFVEVGDGDREAIERDTVGERTENGVRHGAGLTAVVMGAHELDARLHCSHSILERGMIRGSGPSRFELARDAIEGRCERTDGRVGELECEAAPPRRTNEACNASKNSSSPGS